MAVYLFMARSPFSGSVRTLDGVVAPFINVLGVLFGLTLAFLANDTWTAHDRAINTVLHEAHLIRTVVILSCSLGPTRAGRTKDAVTRYAEAAIAEWPLLAHGETIRPRPQRRPPPVDRRGAVAR